MREEKKQLERPVESRVPTEYLAPPFIFKGFSFTPKLDAGLKYDSNILAENTGEDSDIIVVAKPSIFISKPYRDHLFVFGANANLERFKDREEENKEEFKLAFRGLLTATSSVSLPFAISYAKKKRSRNAPQDQTLTEKPIDISTLYAETGLNKRFNRLSTFLLGTYSETQLSNGVSASTGQNVIFSDKDNSAIGVKTGLRYEIPRGATGESAEHILYADYHLQKFDYERLEFDNGTFSGNSGDHRRQDFLVGFETNYKGLLFANLGAGLILQNFDDGDLESTKSLNLSGDIEYNFTPKLTLGFKALRNVRQDNDFISGIEFTELAVNADYELLHNLFWDNLIAKRYYDFFDSTREDDDLYAETAIRYYISQGLEAELNASHLQRNSNDSIKEFDRTIFLLSLISSF